MSEKLISIVIPFFNEGNNVRTLYQELKSLEQELRGRYRLEYLFVDNASTDASFKLACELAAQDPAVRVIRHSRNFGYQASILTGYQHATGDAAVELDVDGEDDPKFIKEFIRKWEEGYKVVYGIRRFRYEKPWVTWQRKLFYRVVKSISSVPLPVDAGDFRLIDRTVLDIMVQHFPESTLYLRGIVSYIGFSQVGLTYDRRPRFDGRSKFGYWAAIRFAWHGVAAFSRTPLIVSAWLGVLGSIISVGLGLLILAQSLFSGRSVSGSSLVLLVMLILGSAQLFGMGIIGAYLGRVFEEVKHRPRAIVEARVGFPLTSSRAEVPVGGPVPQNPAEV